MYMPQEVYFEWIKMICGFEPENDLDFPSCNNHPTTFFCGFSTGLSTGPLPSQATRDATNASTGRASNAVGGGWLLGFNLY